MLNRFPVLGRIIASAFCCAIAAKAGFAVRSARAADDEGYRSRLKMPPTGSWEAWILRATRPELAKLYPANRPDDLDAAAPLPLWVDCHLSWRLDHPTYRRSLRLPRGLLLKGNARRCRGQIEEWAP